MVQNGTLTGDVYYSGCSYIELKQPCAIYNSYLESTCKGQFEFRDQNNNNALVVTLDIEREYALVCLVICLLCHFNICCPSGTAMFQPGSLICPPSGSPLVC